MTRRRSKRSPRGVEVAFTGDDGHFSLEDLPPGEIVDVALDLPDGKGARGELPRGGRYVHGATITETIDLGDRLLGGLSLTDDTGCFALPFLEPGAYEVVVEPRDGDPVVLHLDLPEEGRLDIALDR